MPRGFSEPDEPTIDHTADRVDRIQGAIGRSATLQYVASHRTTMMTEDINDSLGSDYCERTIRRDLEELELLGVVERVRARGHGRGGWCIDRWRWINASVRSAVFSRLAEVRSNERDPLRMEAVR